METKPAPASQETQDSPPHEMTPGEEGEVEALVDTRGLSYFEAIAIVCELSVAMEYHKQLTDAAKPRTIENPARKHVTAIIKDMNARNASRLGPDDISPAQFAALVQAAKDRRGMI